MRNQKYEAFLEAARTGSFKQAASELGYTQAGVSYLANALEKELGVRLFVREHGGVRLTSEGAALLPWIQEVCASERQARDASCGLEAAGRRVASYRRVHEHAHAMATADNEALHRGAPAYRSAHHLLR